MILILLYKLFNLQINRMPKTKIAATVKASKKIPSKNPNSKAIKKTAPADGGMKMKKKFRYKAGTVVLREVKKYQKTVDNLLI